VRIAVNRFFDGYVESDGRVVRRDQGGDTVSEGQGYAMLLAAATGARKHFDRVWGWTRANLERPDGLFAYHWANGHVVDRNPASDADLDIARALLVAARRFGDDEYRREAVGVGRAVLAHETVAVKGGRLLVAGPWARKAPFVVNPSYSAPETWRQLRAVTQDERWSALADTSRTLIIGLVRGSALPADWVLVGVAGNTRPVASPDDRSSPPRYGPDAQRLPLRLGESCDSRDVRTAAMLWRRLRGLPEAGADLSYGLDGGSADGAAQPLGAAAAAAAARAAGDRASAGRLLARAEALGRARPTYYGTAWAALARLLLTTHLLGGC
jgi:endoglucanase